MLESLAASGTGELKCRVTLFDKQDENELSSSSGAWCGSEVSRAGLNGDGVCGVGPIKSLSETGGSEHGSPELWEKLGSDSCGGMVPSPSELISVSGLCSG